jgi:hypothetical protein
MKESSSWYSTCSSLTTSGISGILVDLELTDELDLNNLFIFASLGLPGSDFYCFGLSTARHLSITLHLCSPTRFPRSYVCVLSVCPPGLPGLPSALNCTDGTLKAVSFSYYPKNLNREWYNKQTETIAEQAE